MKRSDLMMMRLAMAVVLMLKGFDALFATVMTLAYRLNFLGITDALAGMTPGDDAGRLVPLMEGVPMWLHLMWVAAGVLYIAGAVLAVVGREKAYLPVIGGLVVEVAARAAGQPVLDAIGVRANADPNIFTSLIVPLALPAIAALALALYPPGKARPVEEAEKRA